jgi:hypothetical protein
MIFKDIFRLFIKLTALYYAFFGFVFFLETLINFNSNNFLSLSNFWVIIVPLSYVLLFCFLFIKTDFIISLLNLNTNFSAQKINISNINSKDIIKIALFIVGFLIFIENIPEFISHCFYSFKYSAQPKIYIDNSYTKTDYIQFTTVGIKIILGYLIIFNHRRLSTWIDKKQE